ncbi:MAG: bifunctional metallophosphatase/5'-nucleotidase [Clostridia bacterium]|nr:bifunctional metallophosphatase/5'-nucleotidase [Clostridia bacterium]
MNQTKKLTILHANDFHGQISFKIEKDYRMVGGISLLSGYIKKVRDEEPAVFCAICGDILQDNIQNACSKGINTVKLLNLLQSDALSLGNHEMEYGLSHLLMFKECISTPILCANLLVHPLDKPLFEPSRVFEANGVRVLAIGVIPEHFMNGILADEFCSTMLSYKDSYEAIRTELRKHRNEKIDLTVVMSHYGIEGDRLLARNMPEDLRVDVILGGHSHIKMEREERIGNTLVVQSNYGMTHVGRLDLDIDAEKGGIVEHRWELVEINNELCDFDGEADSYVDHVLYDRNALREDCLLCQFAEQYEHQSRLEETDLGDLVADAFLDIYKPDFVIVQSGSLRLKACGPDVKLETLKKLYPYDDNFVCASLTGREIRCAFDYLFSLKPDGSVMNGTFQYSRGFKLIVDVEKYKERGCRVEYIGLDGESLDDERTYTVGMTKNCLLKFKRYFGFVVPEEKVSLTAVSTFSDLARWMITQNEKIAVEGKGRFEVLHGDRQ